MDAFEYLKEDATRVADRLTATAKNYSEWTFDRVFEETKKGLEGIRQHLNKETILLQNLKGSDGVEKLLQETDERKGALKDDVDGITQIHVDEPGFEQALESIAGKFRDYNKFTADKLYPSLKKKLSKDDVEHVNQQLEQMIMS